MGRKKLDLTYISDGTARKKSFNYRKKGLMKKLSELKVLCDVDACAVIYNQFNSSPQVWPSKSGVKKILEKFEMLTEKEKTCRSVTHEEFLNHEIKKVRKKIQQLTEENKETYMRELMFGCLSGNMGDLILNDNDRPDLCTVIDQYVKNLIQHKNLSLNNPNFEIGESSSMAMARNLAPPTTGEVGSSSFLNNSTFNSSQPTNNLKSIISSNKGPEHVISLASNFLNAPTLNSLKVSSKLKPKITSSGRIAQDNSVASIPQTSSNQEVYTPVMNQDEFYNLNQNQIMQQRFVEEMMKLGEQTCFPWMEVNHHSTSVDADANGTNVMSHLCSRNDI